MYHKHVASQYVLWYHAHNCKPVFFPHNNIMNTASQQVLGSTGISQLMNCKKKQLFPYQFYISIMQ